MSEQFVQAQDRGRSLPASRVRFSPPLVRRLAWLAIAAQPLFVASWVVAGALQHGYSHAESGVSALGARDAAHPWIVNTGIVLLGLSIAALGPCVLAVLPRRRAATVAAALFVAAGILFALIAAAPIDCDLAHAGCRARFDANELSWRTDAHLWLGLAFDLAFVATPFALARALWPGPIALSSLSAGFTGIAITVGSAVVTNGLGAAEGIIQRLGFVPLHLWVLIVAIGVLHVLPTRADAGVLVPVRPRDFFGRAWVGRGQVTLYPQLLWRRFPLAIDFRRDARPLSDESWVFTDTITFTNGFRIVRRMICVMEDPTRVKVIAEDMPGGAELVLTEGGFRVRPYRYTYPVGPVGLTFTCHDRVRANADGSLDWGISLRWLRLPTVLIAGRVRPEV
jgi:hypothetical protein